MVALVASASDAHLPAMAITQAEAEATLENALSEMNETLAFLAEHGFEATLRPDGPIFEAYLATPVPSWRWCPSSRESGWKWRSGAI